MPPSQKATNAHDQISELQAQLDALRARIHAAPSNEASRGHAAEDLQKWFRAQRKRLWFGTLSRFRTSVLSVEPRAEEWLPRAVDRLRAELNGIAPELRATGLCVEAHTDGTVGVFLLSRQQRRESGVRHRQSAAPPPAPAVVPDPTSRAATGVRSAFRAPTQSMRGKESIFVALQRIDLDHGAGEALVRAWTSTHGTKIVRAADLLATCEKHGVFVRELGRFGNAAARIKALGIMLKSAAGRSFDGQRVHRIEIDGRSLYVLQAAETASAREAS